LTPDCLTIVGWLWRQEKSAIEYTPERANIWARMIDRHLKIPHRFVLMTDQPQAAFDPLIEARPLWDDWREIRNPNWAASKPHCYVRLKAFSDEAKEIFGPRFVSIDLDCVVVGDLGPLFTRSEDFLIYQRGRGAVRDPLNTYNGSMWLMTAGARAQVWTNFQGAPSIAAASAYLGSDQAWMRHVLGPNEKGWTPLDGVWAWTQIRYDARFKKNPPPGARIVFFQGGQKPWNFKADPPPELTCPQCGGPVPIVAPEPWTVTWSQPATTHASSSWIVKNYQ